MKKTCVSGVLLFIVVFLSGCVASNSMIDLKKDKPVSSERSVVFWKIRVTDKTGTVAKPGSDVVPNLYIQRLDVANYGSSHIVYPYKGNSPPSTNFKKCDDGYRYEQMMAVSLDPGRYHIKSLFFRFDNNTRLPLDINRLFRAMPGKLYYIGSLNIIIHDKVNSELSYSFDIDYDKGRQEDMATFVSCFPDISSSFGNKPVLNRLSAYYKYDFSYDIGEFPDFIRTDDILAEIDVDKTKRSYIIQRFSENENSNVIINKRIHTMSNKDSFIVEWDSKWVEGVNHLSYGLLLGSNPQNAYYFSASGDRKSAVLFKKNDRWQSDLCSWKSQLPKGENSLDSDHYKVDFSTDRIVYSVNGQKVAEFDNILQFDSFVIGLFVSGKESIIFDDIIIDQKPFSEVVNN